MYTHIDLRSQISDMMSFFQDGRHSRQLESMTSYQTSAPPSACCSVRRLPASSPNVCDITDLLYALQFLIDSIGLHSYLCYIALYCARVLCPSQSSVKKLDFSGFVN